MSLLNRTTRPREDAELNLIPLIDVMSVLVAFLLIYTADVDIVQNTKGVEIPQSTAETQAQQSVVVMITRDHLFVQGELVANLADINASSRPAGRAAAARARSTHVAGRAAAPPARRCARSR